jgi:C1A family cysteine protease
MPRARITPRKISRYGWSPDVPDGRDHLYAASAGVLEKLPARVDLRRECPPVYDQGDLGSCTGNAIAAALEFDQMKQGIKRHWTPSRLFIYYNERVIENTVDSDSGAQIRDGMKSVAKQGAPPEKQWPYDIDKFRNEPPRKCYTEAAKHVAIRYQRLAQTLNQLKGCLAEGYPFVFGFMVYDSFESEEVAKTGDASLPRAREKQIGGHAVLAVGYEEARQRFIVRNSWGTSWGKRGYFTLPYPYLMQSTLASDFWTVRAVS